MIYWRNVLIGFCVTALGACAGGQEPKEPELKPEQARKEEPNQVIMTQKQDSSEISLPQSVAVSQSVSVGKLKSILPEKVENMKGIGASGGTSYQDSLSWTTVSRDYIGQKQSVTVILADYAGNRSLITEFYANYNHVISGRDPLFSKATVPQGIGFLYLNSAEQTGQLRALVGNRFEVKIEIKSPHVDSATGALLQRIFNQIDLDALLHVDR